MRFRANEQKEIPKVKTLFLFLWEYFLVFIKKRRSVGLHSMTGFRVRMLRWTSIMSLFTVREKKEQTRVAIEAESLEEFLSSYSVVRKGSYGKAYLRRRHFVSVIRVVKRWMAEAMRFLRSPDLAHRPDGTRIGHHLRSDSGRVECSAVGLHRYAGRMGNGNADHYHDA